MHAAVSASSSRPHADASAQTRTQLSIQLGGQGPQEQVGLTRVPYRRLQRLAPARAFGREESC